MLFIALLMKKLDVENLMILSSPKKSILKRIQFSHPPPSPILYDAVLI